MKKIAQILLILQIVVDFLCAILVAPLVFAILGIFASKKLKAATCKDDISMVWKVITFLVNPIAGILVFIMKDEHYAPAEIAE